MHKIPELDDNALSYVDSCRDELENITEQLLHIPAPSHHEEKRAEFCRKWLCDNGCEAYIDEAKNVIFPFGDTGENDLVVFCAHTDTVFPDMEPLPFRKDETTIYSPSCGDDTVCVAMLLLCARYAKKHKIPAKTGILFIANSCEEGLGNLKGTRAIMEEYGKRIKAFYSFDSKYSFLVNRCVGSHRFEVEVKTEGGHSFSGFGKPNAIHIASRLIARLYEVEVPKREGSVTTYNVGTIEGGTSVNTIAQNCRFLYEYRSNDVECMAEMQSEFERIIAEFSRETEISVRVIGERPCMKGVDEKELDDMAEKCRAVQEKYSGKKCAFTAGSTDCNIPLSMGIPALALGVFEGAGEHTREEYIIRESLPKGLRIALEIILSYTA